MRYFLYFIILFSIVRLQGQNHIDIHHYNEIDNQFANRNIQNLTNDINVDAKFYHIDVEIAIDAPFISGNISYIFTSNVNDLTKIHLDLDDAFEIDSLSNEIDSFTHENKQLTLYLNKNYQKDELITFKIHYHGIPVKPGGYKGLRYEVHGDNEPIIATLSTPFLAHSWWACKDGPEDKVDSVYIDITIKDTAINDIPMIAVSNGMLENVVELNDGKKQFQWRHRYPIVPYYIMAAISNYVLVEDHYSNGIDSFPLHYYTFNENKEQTITGTATMSDMLDFMTEYFGPYPFKNEKYGMTELGYYGAIENQTNTITNNMSIAWESITLHELAHQWFADMITCETWHDGWLNEGFASYCEALFYEYQSNSFVIYQNYIEKEAYYNGGTISLQNIDDPFKIFQRIIYNKGAYTLHMLRGVMGDTDFFAAMKKYAMDHRFTYSSATTQDFQSICETESGLDLEYFFDQWIYDEYYPEYEYNYFEDQGLFWVRIIQNQHKNAHREIFEMPIEIQVDYKIGSDTTFYVHNNTQDQLFSFTIEEEVSEVILDPNNWILKKSIFNPDLFVTANNAVYQSEKYITPNPSSGMFYLEKPSSLLIFDTQGHEISPVRSKNSIDLSMYPNGIYFAFDLEKNTFIKLVKISF